VHKNSTKIRHFSSTSSVTSSKKDQEDDIWTKERVNSYIGHTFPDFIEGWNRKVYRKVGYGKCTIIYCKMESSLSVKSLSIFLLLTLFQTRNRIGSIQYSDLCPHSSKLRQCCCAPLHFLPACCTPHSYHSRLLQNRRGRHETNLALCSTKLSCHR